MRLSTRLLLPLLAAVAIVMALYAAWSLDYRRRTLTAQARLETQAYAAALGVALEFAFRDHKPGDVQEIINRISREPKIYGVLVYNAAAELLFVSDPLQLHHGAPLRTVRHVLATEQATTLQRYIDDQHVYSVLRPITHPSGGIVGAFEVAQPLSFVQVEILRTTQRFLLNTLTLLAAITAVILWLVRRLIARPLDRLLAAVRALGRGELGHRIPETGAAHEIVELGREFNRMAHHLETARAELVRESDERVALERRLREAEKLAAIGNVAAGLAHEIGAPLNVIAGRAEMLLRRETPPADRQRNLRIIVDQIARITAIVRNLLDFARRREPRLRPVELGQVADGAVELLEGEFAAAGIDLKRESAGQAWALGDPQLLHQVVLNVLANAVHALENHEGQRRIVLRTLPPAAAPGPDPHAADGAAAMAAIEIEDTGPGIPPDVLPHVFEPFFTTKPAGAGTGLGLAVASSIVEAHGGRIQAENAASGGARFRIALPAANVQEPAHA